MTDSPLTRIWRGIDDRMNRLVGNDVLRRAETALKSHEDDQTRIARVKAEWTALKARFEGLSSDEAEAEFSRRVDELDAELAEIESDIADNAELGTLLDDLRVVAKRRQRILQGGAASVFGRIGAKRASGESDHEGKPFSYHGPNGLRRVQRWRSWPLRPCRRSRTE